MKRRVFVGALSSALILLSVGCTDKGASLSEIKSSPGSYFKEGVHYTVLDRPFFSKKNEVIEFFWYGCPHCYDADPHVKNWLIESKKSPSLKLMHSQLSPGWSFDALNFYSFNEIKADKSVHDEYFSGRNSGKISNDSDLKFILEKHGIDYDYFKTIRGGGSVKEEMINANKLESIINSRGVPAFVVGGKYIVNIGGISSFGWGAIGDLLDYLISLP